MPSFLQRRHLVALILTALMTLPSLALAAPRAQERSQAVHATFASQIWSFLQRLWGSERMTIDPNGRTTTQANPSPRYPAGDAGMLIDPDGAH